MFLNVRILHEDNSIKDYWIMIQNSQVLSLVNSLQNSIVSYAGEQFWWA